MKEKSTEKLVARGTGRDEPLGLSKEPIATWRLVLILLCIGLGLFVSLMDTTIVATILLAVSDEFGGYEKSPWVLLAYMLSYVGFAVTIAKLSDAVGRKPAILASFFVFLAASMGCGASANIEQLIGFRAVQGIGGAGLYSMAMIVYPEITPAAAVPIISAVIGMVVAIAGICGPVFGGLLTTHADWRYAFWINGPIAFVPMIALVLLWPKRFRTFKKVQFKELDYVGILLVMVATVLPVFILNQAAVREYAWNSGTTIAILVLSGLAWISLILWQWYLFKNPRSYRIRPQVPFQLLKDRVLLAVIMSTLLTGFIIFTVIVNISLRAQIVNVYSAVKSGVLLLPFMGGSAVGSAAGGAISSKKNLTFYTLVVASALSMIGTGLMSTIPDGFTPSASQYGYEAILGVGVGLNLSTSTLVTSLQARFEDHAIAQGIVAQIRVFGGTIGIAASFIVLNTKIHDDLSTVLSPQQLSDFYKSPAATAHFELLEQFYVRQTYINAFAIVMRMCLGVAAASFVAALCTYQRNPLTMKQRMADLEALYDKEDTVPPTPSPTPSE
ncbi:hypothetical protein PWT90_07962 [Aphanocladium album]|nr:hypothetical protein PWT90_07962 [Aphanocladium album]